MEELNTPRQGGHSKDDRIGRLEPDIRDGRFYLPCVAFHADYIKQQPGHGLCYWSVWTEKEEAAAKAQGLAHNNNIGQIVYRPWKGLTKRQAFYAGTADKRIVTALKRRDENNDVYDVTRAFIEELVRHPFAQYVDLIDAASRIYDIDPQAPVAYEAQSTEPLDNEAGDLVGSDAEGDDD